jgi:hypothetical protein
MLTASLQLARPPMSPFRQRKVAALRQEPHREPRATVRPSGPTDLTIWKRVETFVRLAFK